MDAHTREMIRMAISEKTRQTVVRDDPGRVELPSGKSRNGHEYTIQHGTEKAYCAYKCRCLECRTAAARGRQRRRERDPEAARKAWREQDRARRARGYKKRGFVYWPRRYGEDA